MFGKKAKIRKAVTRALASVEGDAELADHAAIDALPAALHLQAYYTLVLALREDERYEAAWQSLSRALALEPGNAQLQALAGELAIERGDVVGAIAAHRSALAGAPRDTATAVALADTLLRAERVAEAIEVLQPLRDQEDPEVDAKLAEALYVQGDNAMALAILDRVCELYDHQLKRAFSLEWRTIKNRADEAMRLRDDVYAEIHGREATIDLHAAAGKLDARAGVNYSLLGARLAATSTRIADVLTLDTPDATERRGQAMLERSRAHGLVLIGSAQLRRGEVAAAHQSFERACEADGRCFAAFLGLGATLDCEQHELHRRVARLAITAGEPRGLAVVVPDLPALTDLERRVVLASAQPLHRVLPVLGERGVAMRILPIDARATDIGLFEDAAGERADDHRSYDAIGGVATHGGAIAKIEGLLDIVTGGGWTFAHELAHLAFFHMTEADAASLVALYERALEVGYANIEYALSNVDEFFAVSYAEYLRHRHGLPGVPEADDAGIRDALIEYFDQLAAS